MSIQSQINRLVSAKSAIASAITLKGVSVSSATKLSGMASLIDQIFALHISEKTFNLIYNINDASASYNSGIVPNVNNFISDVGAFFPNLSNTISSFMYNAYAVTDIHLPKCINIAIRAFYEDYKISRLELPKCETISTSAFFITFSSSGHMSYAYLPVCTAIHNSAFGGQGKLISLYLLANNVCTLSNINALNKTPLYNNSITASQWGSIYVPASLLNSYKAATNWITVSSRIVGV